MSLSTQAKILRVLEERIVDRLGATEGARVDLRIIAATNKVLSEAVTAEKFREDLYYRLRVFQIDLPPLRERREDILPLAQHFLSMHRAEDRPVVELSPRTKEILLADDLEVDRLFGRDLLCGCGVSRHRCRILPVSWFT